MYPFLWSLAWPAPLLPSCHLPVTDAEVVAIPRVVAAAAAAELVAPGCSATGTTPRRLPLSHAWRSGLAFPGKLQPPAPLFSRFPIPNPVHGQGWIQISCEFAVSVGFVAAPQNAVLLEPSRRRRRLDLELASCVSS